MSSEYILANREYRFYHCTHDWKGLQCTKVPDSFSESNSENTKLMFVDANIPERFDKIILRFSINPIKIIIKNST